MTYEVNASPSGPVRRVGVIGTLVWDTIRGIPGKPELEDWGGIAYSLAALEGTLPKSWEVVPLLKVGSDFAEPALEYLESFTCLDVAAGVDIVHTPNNRVTLRYSSDGRRLEQLTGGVPGWTWAELRPHMPRLDALYVNFISGFEMTLDDARRLPQEFGGATYADLHSLFLGVDTTGQRFLRPLPSGGGWAECFDSVQMNEDEFSVFAGEVEDPWEWARHVVGGLPKAVVVTLGQDGAAAVVSSAARKDVAEWGAERGTPAGEFAEVLTVTAKPAIDGVDPTGCGDVWGASFFGNLLKGEDLIVSMECANQMAKRNVNCQGSSALLSVLRDSSAAGEAAG